ncbi:MAG: PH domain-containing protein [Clostridia bacterium]|nr:PH domain-containing protein [Clostridia bacterium]
MMAFKPQSSNGFKWGLVLLAFVLGIILLPIVISDETPPLYLLPYGLIMAIVSGLIGYLVYAVKNMEYRFEKDTLVIKYGFSKKVIPLEKINGVEEHIGTWKAMKNLGSSWPGFHLGGFTIPGLGDATLYCTALRGRLILLRTGYEPVGLSPADVDGFIQALKSARPDLTVKQVEFRGEDYLAKSGELWRDRVFQGWLGVNLVVIGVMFLWVYTIIPDLPERIPLHWGPQGVDRYGSPTDLYATPLISLGLFLFMTVVAHFAGRGDKIWAYFALGLNAFWTGILALLLWSTYSNIG